MVGGHYSTTLEGLEWWVVFVSSYKWAQVSLEKTRGEIVMTNSAHF